MPPVEISNVTELQAMENDLAADYVLVNDIDASATSTWNGGAGFEPVGPLGTTQFTGSFDGGGFAIADLFIERGGTERLGLFGWWDGSTCSDALLVDPNITSTTGQQSGTLIGRMAGGTITRCGTRGGSVTTNAGDTGGVIGFVAAGSVEHIFNVGTAVVGSGDAGGVVGDYRGSTALSKSFSTGAVTGNGGLCGRFSGSAPVDCFWDEQTSGQTGTTGGGTGKTTAEMQDIDTFTDTATVGLTNAWDMVLLANHDGEFATAVWAIDDGVDYPLLWFEVEPSSGVDAEGLLAELVAEALDGSASSGAVNATAALAELVVAALDGDASSGAVTATAVLSELVVEALDGTAENAGVVNAEGLLAEVVVESLDGVADAGPVDAAAVLAETVVEALDGAAIAPPRAVGVVAEVVVEGFDGTAFAPPLAAALLAEVVVVALDGAASTASITAEAGLAELIAEALDGVAGQTITLPLRVTVTTAPAVNVSAASAPAIAVSASTEPM